MSTYYSFVNPLPDPKISSPHYSHTLGSASKSLGAIHPLSDLDILKSMASADIENLRVKLVSIDVMGNRLVYEVQNRTTNKVYYVPMSIELENELLDKVSDIVQDFYNRTEIIIGDSIEKLTHSLSPSEFLDYLCLSTRQPCALVVRSLENIPNEVLSIFSKPDGERYFILKHRTTNPKADLKLVYLPFFPLQEIIHKCLPSPSIEYGF